MSSVRLCTGLSCYDGGLTFCWFLKDTVDSSEMGFTMTVCSWHFTSWVCCYSNLSSHTTMVIGSTHCFRTLTVFLTLYFVFFPPTTVLWLRSKPNTPEVRQQVGWWTEPVWQKVMEHGDKLACAAWPLSKYLSFVSVAVDEEEPHRDRQK